MKTRIITGAIAFVLGSLVQAQTVIPENVVLCRTMDGTVNISATQMTLRDYAFALDRVQEPGVVVLRDARCDAVAEIDSRSDEGLYIAVREGGITMQIIAPRSGITFKDGTPLDAPSAPSVGESLGGEQPPVNLAQLVRRSSR